MPVGHAPVVVRLVAQLDACHVLQAQHLARGQRLDDHVAELFGRDEAALVFHRVLEHAFVVLAERAGGGLNVLRVECRGHVGGNDAILRHHVRLQPDAHAVVRAEQRHLAHAGDTLQLGDDVDLEVVVEELRVVAVVGAPQGDGLQHGLLLLVGDDADAGDVCRQLSLRLRHAVLHVHRRHVRVGALLEVDGDVDVARVGGGGVDVGHVLHAVDGFLQRHDDGFQHRLGVGAGIAGGHLHRGRGDVGELLDGQRHQRDAAQQHDGHRDDDGQHRAFNECLEFHKVSSFLPSWGRFKISYCCIFIIINRTVILNFPRWGRFEWGFHPVAGPRLRKQSTHLPTGQNARCKVFPR